MEERKDSVWAGVEKVFGKSSGYAYWMDRDLVILGCTQSQAKLFGHHAFDSLQGKPLDELIFFKQQPQLAQTIKENNLTALKSTGSCGLYKEVFEQESFGKYELLTYKLLISDQEATVGLLSIAISTDYINDLNEPTPKNTQSIALQEIISNMPEHVYWKDSNGVYLGCNDKQAQSLGLNKGFDVVGKTDFDLLWGDKAAREIQDNDKKIMCEGKQQIFEEEAQLANGQIAKFLSYKTPLRDHSGNVIGILGISTDITERKFAEEEREKIAVSNAVKQTTIAETEAELRQAVMILTGSIAHDLRTPLASIHLLTSFLKKQMSILLEAYTLAINANLPLSKKIHDQHMSHLVKIDTSFQESIDDMHEFIDTTLQTLKVGLKQDLEKDDLMRCSMWHCLHNTLLRYPFLTEQKNLVTWDQKDFAFMGNEIMMIRVFSNLIKNSLEQIAKNGKGNIMITTEKGNDVNTIRFKDTAGGASADVIDTLFEGYKTTKAKGTGIGLAFCRITLESFGGSITCNSVENEFIEFMITLPNLGATNCRL